MNNKIFLKLAVFICAICLFKLADAAPDITSVDGTVQKGNTISIEGNGFGNKLSAAPLKYDFFEQSGAEYEVGNKIKNDWVGGDSISPPYYNPKYHSSNYRTGSTKHIRTEWPSPNPGSEEAGENDSHCPFYYDHNAPLKEIYVTFYVRIKIPSFVTADLAPNVKWFRVVNETDPFYGYESPTLYTSFVLYDDPDSPYYKLIANKTGMRGNDGQTGHTEYHTLPVDNGWNGKVPTPVNDVWIRCEYILKESSAPGGVFDGTADGSAVVYYQMGGVGNKFIKVSDQTGIITNQSGNDLHWEAIRFSEYNRNELLDMTIDYDDIYIDNTQARIEIGDDAVWENCTHREIQIPESWSDTSIEFIVNTGSFSDGQAFLFIIDSNGGVSLGKPIVIGSKTETDLPPGAPSSLIIVE